MFEAISPTVVGLHALLLMLWAVAAYCATSLTKLPNQAALKQRARKMLWLLLPIVLLTGSLVLTMTVPYLRLSGPPLQEGLLLQVPMLILSTAAALLFSLPRLWAIVRYIGNSRKPLCTEQRRLAADPYFVTPVFVSTASAACSLYYALAPPLALTLSWKQLLLPPLALLLVFGIVAISQQRIHRRLSSPARQAA